MPVGSAPHEPTSRPATRRGRSHCSRRQRTSGPGSRTCARNARRRARSRAARGARRGQRAGIRRDLGAAPIRAGPHPDPGPGLRSRVNADLASAFADAFDLGRARTHADTAVAAAREVGSREVLLRALAVAAYVATITGDPAADALLREGMALERPRESCRDPRSVRFVGALRALYEDRIEDARRTMDDLAQAAEAPARSQRRHSWPTPASSSGVPAASPLRSRSPTSPTMSRSRPGARPPCRWRSTSGHRPSRTSVGRQRLARSQSRCSRMPRRPDSNTGWASSTEGCSGSSRSPRVMSAPPSRSSIPPRNARRARSRRAEPLHVPPRCDRGRRRDRPRREGPRPAGAPRDTGHATAVGGRFRPRHGATA